ncbi:MAG: DNA polymerase III subunit psi [Candidatus Malihini olakiniferum]
MLAHPQQICYYNLYIFAKETIKIIASRRDWILQQIGITQWILHRHNVLQGEIAVTLPAQTHLVIIADPLPDVQDPLVADVLRSLSLCHENLYLLTPEKIAMLPASTHCHTWCLGVDVSPAWIGIHLTSPTLDELYVNPSAKRALWKQISDIFSY